MTRPVLLTQCIQRDFLAPTGPHTPPPNLLHVGHREAERLLGVDPSTGPLAQLMTWARALPKGSLPMLHVRDRHDPSDPAQAEHLRTFGPHCVQGTRGAELVLDLERGLGPDEQFIDATGLNDVEETDLAAALRTVSDGAPLRAAVVGVWTDAKVTFLLYDLATRLGVRELATCSALTASASRTAHVHALEQLRRVLGVRVFDSVGELAEWLVPAAEGVRPSQPPPAFRAVIEGADLDEADADLTTHLFRGASKVTLTPLGGGFSGARVYFAHSVDPMGHPLVPSVLKLGPRALVGRERAAFEQVEAILGNDAPRLLGVADHGERGGLRYAFAAMGRGRVRTLKSIWESGAPDDEIERVLRCAFEEILGRFYAAATWESLPLLAFYGFSPSHAASVRRHAAAAAAPGEEALVEELAAFYAEGLGELGATPGERHYVSYVHGDLNGANILVDDRANVWLIDFFHTRRGHVLADLVKFENDLLFLFTRVETDEDARELDRIVEALGAVEDLRAPLPTAVEGVTSAAMQRVWRVLRVLREIGAALVREDRHPVQRRVAALRYAAHTMSFDEANPRQRRAAFLASVGHARAVLASARADRALRVGFVTLGPGRVGMTICPGRIDRGRDLGSDLDAIRATGATVLVSLLTEDELAFAGVEALGTEARARGITHVRLPIRDQDVPRLDEMRALSTDLVRRAARGETVVVHCLGGLGRSGLAAACALVEAGASADDALSQVRAARGPRAVESPAQEAFVRAYTPG